MRTIPVDPTLPDQEFGVVLDKVPIVLGLRWNARAGLWVLSISDAAGVIASGLPVVVGPGLLQRLTSPRLPPGELVAVDTAGAADPGERDLGARVELVYVEAAEIAAAQA